MRTMKVNPGRTKEGKDLVVLNEAGNRIKRTPGGTEVPRTSFYNRLLKDQDLVLAEPVKRVKAVKKRAGKKLTKLK